MKAYKVFNPDWTCRGFKYEVGETYSIREKPIVCVRGFHACKNVSDCFNYYSFDPDNKVAEVELLGVVVGEDGDKQCSNTIKIVKELKWAEVLELANSGKGNSGNRNSGNWNSGNWNSGNRNSGNRNSGNRNSGDWNSGNRNSGDCNSGNWNSGNWNSGDCNSGNWNSGDCNSGNWNSGNWNSGNWNSGNWNLCDRETGHFNSISPLSINVFNKPCPVSVWDDCNKPDYFWFSINEWIKWDDMTDEEKKQYPNAFTRGGYLKRCDYKEAWIKSFNNASDSDKELARKLPNFDPKVFYEITGIDYYLNSK